MTKDTAHVQAAISKLSSALGDDRVLLPSSDAFESERKGYWSTVNQELRPLAIVVPTSAEDVAAAVPVLAASGCNFGVRSGGHAPFAQSNTAENGVLISLSKLKQFVLDENTGILQLGPGYRWGEVYDKLQTHGRTAVGGRYADVGVGGFLTGGGMSHMSNAHGMAVDNIVNLEIVLASGEKVYANSETNADLFWAVKGGGNNFGIVTRFDLKTIKQEKVWGGLHLVLPSHNDAALEVLDDYIQNGQAADPESSVVIPFCFQKALEPQLGPKAIVAILQLYHGAAVEKPESLKKFCELPAFHSTLRFTTHGEIPKEIAVANNTIRRHAFFVGAFQAVPGANKLAYDAFFKTVEQYDLYSKIICIAYTPQPISKSMTTPATGLFKEALSKAHSVWYDISVEYDDSVSNEEINNFGRDAVANVTAATEKSGPRNDFLFLNDVGPGQDVMRSYGKEAFEKLLSVSKKYDKDGVFQRLVGGAKLKP